MKRLDYVDIYQVSFLLRKGKEGGREQVADEKAKEANSHPTPMVEEWKAWMSKTS